jgi:hypothetical protein
MGRSDLEPFAVLLYKIGSGICITRQFKHLKGFPERAMSDFKSWIESLEISEKSQDSRSIF